MTDRSLEPGLVGGAALLDLVDATLGGDPSTAAEARRAIVTDLGEDGLLDAAAVIANFEMMNRVADGTGMPVGKGTLERTKEWRSELGIDVFNHL